MGAILWVFATVSCESDKFWCFSFLGFSAFNLKSHQDKTGSKNPHKNCLFRYIFRYENVPLIEVLN